MSTATAEQVEMKEVKIMRVPEGGSHLPSEVMDNAKMKLSSVIVNQRPHRGLSQEQEAKYLPEIIGVSADHNEFADRARTFWAELSLDVPQEGHLLQVPQKPPGPQGPHVESWIQYQWAKEHPQVAESRQEAESDPRKRFYIYDPEREARRQNQESRKKRAAYIELHKASENEEKLDLLVRVVANQNPATLSKQEKENLLDNEISASPEPFIAAARDEDLRVKAAVKRAVDNNVIQRYGNQYVYQDETIASTMDEAIAWWKNDRNSSVVQEIQAKVKEAEA